MKFIHLKWRFRLAGIFWAAGFLVFSAYLLFSQLGIFLPNFFLVDWPLRLTQFIFGWEEIYSWKAYVSCLILSPLYYTIIGYFTGLIIEKFKSRKK